MLVSGLMVSFGLSYAVYQLEQRNVQAAFERMALHREAAVERGLENAIDALEDINHLFVTNGNVSEAQFRKFSASLRTRHPYIEAFSFHRLVSQKGRAAYEARMQKRYPGFAITENGLGGRTVAGERGQYRVIEYVEPHRDHIHNIGLDASHLPFHDTVIRRAEETGLPAATGLYRLFTEDGHANPFGIRVVMAVYRGGSVFANVEARRANVLGYTVIVLRAGNMVETMLRLAGIDNGGLGMRVYAADTPDEDKLIYRTPHPENVQRVWGLPAWMFGSGPTPVSRQFDVAGETWHTVVSADPRPLHTTHSRALIALFAGLLTAIAASAYLQSIATRDRRVQQLVTERTSELSLLNERLTDDIKARRVAEQALKDSEERARELAELSSDSFWEQDAGFRFTSFVTGAGNPLARMSPFKLGVTRWELEVDHEAADWTSHRAVLEAHQPFKDFEYKRLIEGCTVQWLCDSGNPKFGADGTFEGYRGTSRDITDRKLAEEALQRSRADLRRLATHRESAKEDERKRIARDIHDELGQSLMVLRLDMSRMARASELPANTRAQIDGALHLIDTSIRSVRAIINDLRPSVLDLGLHAGIQWQAKEFERRSGVPCEVHIDHVEFALDDQRVSALFRCVQESLSNISRHAKASQVWIDMKRKGDQLLMSISDDGIGIFPNCRRNANAFGLLGIEERILALGGTFSIVSEPGEGMSVMLSIPI